MRRHRRLLLVVTVLCSGMLAQSAQPQQETVSVKSSITDFDESQVIEFRRYTIRSGERGHFAQYFDAFFPEAIQQLGAWVAGDFLERGNPSGFTWLRVFRNMDERAKANAQLYYGPVGKEHKFLMNSLMIDSDNVLLLRPVGRNRAVPILRSVDVVTETKLKGVVVAEVFAIKPGMVDAFLKNAEPLLERYGSTAVREAALLRTLDATNNFPQLPVRTDGPFVVWIAVIKDDAVFERQFAPAVKKASEAFRAGGLLRSDPEVIVMDPAARSRLRWLPEWE